MTAAGLQLTYIHSCAKCGETHTQTLHVLAGSELPRPQLPDGWSRIQAEVYCPFHEIVVEVQIDGGRDRFEYSPAVPRPFGAE